jgi:glycine oxidase
VHVIVIGSGVIGAAIADALASRGASVTVLDMRAPGRGASQAAAGMLAPYSEAPDHPQLLSLSLRSLALFDEYVARLTGSTRLNLEYQRRGSIDVAFEAAAVERMVELGRQIAAHGAASEWLEAAALHRAEPAISRRAAGGLFVAAHGSIAVQPFVAALVDRARLSGAVFESPVEAIQVESLADRVSVRAGGTQYSGDAAVVAAGSWSRRVRISHVSALPVRPVRGQLLQLRWRGGTPPQHIVWGPHCYTVPWSDGTLLVGATMEEAGFVEAATVDGVHALTSAVRDLLPETSAAEIAATRVGLRPALPDALPAIGPVSRAPRVVMATGHFRNGVLLAPITAEIVSRYLLDGVSDAAFAVTTPDRFLN